MRVYKYKNKTHEHLILRKSEFDRQVMRNAFTRKLSCNMNIDITINAYIICEVNRTIIIENIQPLFVIHNEKDFC